MYERTRKLHPGKVDDGCQYLSPASYTLSKEEKESMFECLNSIKVPLVVSAQMPRTQMGIRKHIMAAQRRYVNQTMDLQDLPLGQLPKYGLHLPHGCVFVSTIQNKLAARSLPKDYLYILDHIEYIMPDDLAPAMPSNKITQTESDGSTRDIRIYTSSRRSGALNPTPVVLLLLYLYTQLQGFG